MTKATRRAIIVLGMHRSGTSVLAGTLGMLGMRLPDRLFPEGRDNPRGHFEPEQIVAIHDRMLAAAGASWSSIEGLPESWFHSAEALAFVHELAAAVKQDYADAALFVVKDPRMCRLMPLWRMVLAEVGAQASFVIPLRNPLEVARSLEKRDRLPLAYGCLLWLCHVLEAERETRGSRRVFTHFHDLLSDPIRIAEHVASQLIGKTLALNEKSKRDVASLIDPELRHQIANLEELYYPAAFNPWLSDAYEALAALVNRPTDQQAMRQLDRVRAAFDPAVALFVPLLVAQEKALTERDATIANLSQIMAGKDTERDATIANLSQIMAGKDTELLEQQNRISALNQTLTALDETVGAYQTQIDVLTAQTEEIFRSTLWQLLAPLHWFGRQRNRVMHFLRRFSLRP
jgi:hypothetical protein